MDPLSISSSVIGLLSLSQATVSILNDMKDKTKEARGLMIEISTISGLLQSLRFLMEERQDEAGRSEIWLPLLSASGPIEQISRILTELIRKLSPARDSRRSQVGRSLRWPLKHEEIIDMLDNLGKLRSMISLALTGETL